MKAGKLLLIMIAVFMLLGIAACANNKAKADFLGYPKWWGVQGDQDYVFSYGMGNKAKQNLSIEAARADAMAEAARFVKLEVIALVKSFESEAGVFDPQNQALVEIITETVSTAEFSSVQTGKLEIHKIKRRGGLRFYTYVQMKIPREQINKYLYDYISQEEALYDEFKDSHGFLELEKDRRK